MAAAKRNKPGLVDDGLNGLTYQNGNAFSHPSTFSLTGASAGSAVRETAHNLIRLFVSSR